MIETVGALLVLSWEFLWKPLLVFGVVAAIAVAPFFVLAIAWHAFADWWRERGADTTRY